MWCFYVYDALPTLQTLLPDLNAPRLAVFGEPETPKGVKAMCARSGPAIRQIADQAGFSLTPDTASSTHHLPFTIYHLPATSASNDSHRFLRNDGRLGQQRSFVGVHQQGSKPLTLWLQVISDTRHPSSVTRSSIYHLRFTIHHLWALRRVATCGRDLVRSVRRVKALCELVRIDGVM